MQDEELRERAVQCNVVGSLDCRALFALKIESLSTCVAEKINFSGAFLAGFGHVTPLQMEFSTHCKSRDRYWKRGL